MPQIAQLQAQKEHFDNTIKALEDAFELGFTEEYYQGLQFDVDPFYQSISDRIEALRGQAAIATAVAKAEAPAPDAMVEG